MTLPNTNEPDPIELWVLLLLSGGQKMTVHDLVRILNRTLDVIWQVLQRLKNWKYVKDEKGKYMITIEGIEYLALKGISATEPDYDPAPKDFIKKIRLPFFSSWSELLIWLTFPFTCFIITLFIASLFTAESQFLSPEINQSYIWLIYLGIIGIYVGLSIHYVIETKRLVVFRGGKVFSQRGPGAIFVLPLVDHIKIVDMREKSKEINKEPCLTRDKLLIQAGFYISWQIDEPISSLTKVFNVEDSIVLLSTAILRTTISEYILEDGLKMRKAMNSLIRNRIEQKVGDWGVKIINTEVRELQPPENVMKEIEKRFNAELEKEAARAKNDIEIEALQGLFQIGSRMDDRTLDLIKTLRASPHQDKIEEVLPKETLEYLSRNPNADSIHLELPLSSLLPTVDFYEKTEEFVKALESVMHFIGHEQSFLRMF
ncbi:MAG TPA: SPFH domain-containing protein, partial [Rhabdochlamydiaceae bacterium]|nr:SPFH domain-containing protein [Rhabdochlamydiaceae bacterium]